MYIAISMILFISVFVLSFLHYGFSVVPRFFTWVPEVISIFIAFIVCIHLVVHKIIYISMKYVLVMCLLILFSVMSAVMNNVPVHLFVAGFRAHFKHIPFFLLSAIYIIDNRHFKSVLLLLLPLLLLQLPVAILQRFFMYRVQCETGDIVVGTVMSSGILSIMIVSSITVLFSLYLHKSISFKKFCLLGILLFFPSTINETKITLILLPIAIVICIYVYGKHSSMFDWALFFRALGVGIVLAMLFIFIYNTRWEKESGGILGFLGNQKVLTEYLYKNEKPKVGADIRRFDAFVLTFNSMASDKVSFLFGRGIGSATRSILDPSSENKRLPFMLFHTWEYGITYLFWEIGLVGVLLYLTLLFFVFSDSLWLSRSNDLFGIFANAWVSVVFSMFICLFYTNTIFNNALNILFWFFSGTVASRVYVTRKLSQYMDGCNWSRGGVAGDRFLCGSRG